MYPAIGAGVVVFLVFMVFMMRRAFAKAKQATTHLTDGLQSLGLQVVDQSKTGMALQGVYRGRQVAVVTDSSAAVKAGNKAAMGGLMQAGKAALGMDTDSWKQNMKNRKARQRLENAAILQKWQVTLPLDSPVRVVIARDEDDEFVQIGDGMYARFDPAAQGALSNPQVIQALSQGKWDVITIKGKEVKAIWGPALKEHQQHVSSSEAYKRLVQSNLDAITTLCDGLYGPAA
jgi:hypothetical protein